MSVEGQANLGPAEATAALPVKRGDRGPHMPRGTADTPVRVIENLAAIGAHSRHVGDVYVRVYEAAYGLAGRGLDGGGSGSGASMVETAVTESLERARAQDAAVRAAKEVREAEKRLGAALSTLERAIGGRVEELERLERQARDQRRGRR